MFANGRLLSWKMRNLVPLLERDVKAAPLTLKGAQWSSDGGVGLQSNKPFLALFLKGAFYTPRHYGQARLMDNQKNHGLEPVRPAAVRSAPSVSCYAHGDGFGGGRNGGGGRRS